MKAACVGRCFQGHVTYGAFAANAPVSTIAVSDSAFPMRLYTDQARDKIHCVLAARLEGQRRNRIGNFTATLADQAIPLAPETAALFALAGALDRGNAGAAAKQYPTFFMTEHFPNRDSRITLDDAQTDALGMPRVRLDWVYSQRDLDAFEASLAALSAELGGELKGRVCWPVERSRVLSIVNASRHHMGTTRMHADPEHGVVNADSRMHGAANLYIAGSSVFPTSGIANPTLTLIAMTMRLSDHLKRELGARA